MSFDPAQRAHPEQPPAQPSGPAGQPSYQYSGPAQPPLYEYAASGSPPGWNPQGQSGSYRPDGRPVGGPGAPPVGYLLYQAIPQAAPLPLREAIKQLPKQYKQVLTKPRASTFAEEMGKAKWDIIWTQLLGYATFGAILVFLGLLIVFLVLNTLFGALLQPAGADTPFSGSFLGLPLLLLGALAGGGIFILTFVSFFVNQGITYLLAKAFGGQGSFMAQAYTALLYQVPLGVLAALLSLIPFVGSFAGSAASIYMVVLEAFSLMAVHRLSGGKAAAVVIIPIAAGILLAVASYIVFLFFFFNSLPTQ